MRDREHAQMSDNFSHEMRLLSALTVVADNEPIDETCLYEFIDGLDYRVGIPIGIDRIA